jgi:multidrug resistance efflux pump
VLKKRQFQPITAGEEGIVNKIASIKLIAQQWLSFQCRLLQGASNGLVLLDETGGSNFQPAALWSSGGSAPPALTQTAHLAVARRQPVVGKFTPIGNVDQHHVDIAALPLVVNGHLVGAVALVVDRSSDANQQAVLSVMQLGIAWLEFLVSQSADAHSDQLERSLAAITAALQQEQLQAAAGALVTTLATEMKCERVSLGLRGRRHCKLFALSHNARFEKRASLVRDIEAAMDEALEQDLLICHPPLKGDVPAITAAQRELSTRHGGNAVLSIPLVARGRLIGALTMERHSTIPFDAQATEHCRQLAELVAPIIENHRLATQSLGGRVVRAISDFGKRSASRGRLYSTVAIAGMLGLIGWLLTATTGYQVTAHATLEGTVQRMVVAPRDGFIGTAEVTAGDIVETNQRLASLDDKDLQLDRLKWESEREQYLRKHRQRMAEGDRAETTILEAQIAEADAQLALVDEQLARGELRAPFGGVIVKGDLKHSLGAPVKRGDVLLEIAPLDSYRVIVDVDERDIAQVVNGQRGHMVLTALPQQPITLTIDKVTPVSTPAEGRNSFRVEAKLGQLLPSLRPGMSGVAKIDIGPRKRIWIWTHALIDWVRMKTWPWYSA